MLLLAIDTCGPLGTVALGRINVPGDDSTAHARPGKSEEGNDLKILGEADIPGKTWSARLVPAIRTLLEAQGASIAGVHALVVTNGPGSFTGIRIGLSAAKGLAEAHSTPLLAVSRLAVLAYKAQTQAAALDAARGEFYFGDYSGIPAGPARQDGREWLLTREVFLQKAAELGQSLTVCEESAHALAPAASLVVPPRAADAVRCALPRLRAGDYDDPATLDGNYLRRSDAEIFSKPKLALASQP